MLEVLVGNNQQLKPCGFAAIEQIAIADASPRHLNGGRYLVTAKRVTDLNGHLTRREEPSRDDFVFDPLLTEAENVRRLFSVHGGKAFQKIFERKIIG